jgi:hypoxanthine phosphoribosyltransferase
MALPDKFKCVVINWDYIYSLCRDVSNDVKTSGYKPDVIIALARGGWFAGRVMCDFLGLDDLTSLKIEHYIGTAVTGDAKEYVLKQNPKEVRTATLQYLYTSEMDPDYCGERVEDWAWIVYPWNFIEDMMDIISSLMVKEKKDTWDIPAIKHGLYTYHSLDPISFEIAQPGRMIEVLDEMERIGKVTSMVKDGKKLWKLA